MVYYSTWEVLGGWAGINIRGGGFKGVLWDQGLGFRV